VAQATLIDRIATSLQRRGFAGTAQFAAVRARDRWDEWLEQRFDRRYGIDTCGNRRDMPAAFRGNSYEPVTPRMFRAMIRAARVPAGRFTFLDYGCGKGRAVFLAAELGFRRSIGIELNPALFEVARRNALAFRRARRGAGAIDIVLGDATVFRPPADEDAVLFFYNPFGEALMAKTVATIEAACREAPRRRVVAYRNPVHAAVFERSPCFRRLALNRSYALYSCR